MSNQINNILPHDFKRDWLQSWKHISFKICLFVRSKLSCASTTSLESWFITIVVVSFTSIRSSGSAEGMIGKITRGKQLRCSWKPEKPVEECIVFMIWEFIHGRAHPFWLQGTWKHNIFIFTPVKFISAFQNFDINNLSLLHIMLDGRLFSQYQWSKKSRAGSGAEMSVFVGMIQVIPARKEILLLSVTKVKCI